MLDLLILELIQKMDLIAETLEHNDWEKQLEVQVQLQREIQDSMTVDIAEMEKFEAERSQVLNDIRKVESSLIVQREIKARFELLEQQYASDLRRLENTAEAAFLLNQLPDSACPVCGAEPNEQNHEHDDFEQSPGAISEACVVEAQKIHLLMADLASALDKCVNTIAEITRNLEANNIKFCTISNKIDEFIKPRIQAQLEVLASLQTERDAYIKALELKGRIEELRQKQFNLAASTTSQTDSKVGSAINVDLTDTYDICNEISLLLKRWKFPGTNTVVFSELKNDFFISDRERAGHGKGVRAILRAAFNLALMATCAKTSKSHPGIVVLDSPLVVYREPDPEEPNLSIDVKNEFYRSLAKDFKEQQIILLENEEPPADIEGIAKLIKFTGAKHGRTGFIPT